MNVIISEADIKVAADLLQNTYHISTQMLHKIFSAEWHQNLQSVNKQLYNSGVSTCDKLNNYDFIRLVVIKEGHNLFSGRDKVELRTKILETLNNDIIQHLYNEFQPNGNCQARGYQINKLAQLKWVNGKKWARAFTKAADFPITFAGIPQGNSKMPSVEVVPPKPKEIHLKDFQSDLKDRMKKILNEEQDRTKCIVTLPTGGGKTRIAVEAFIEWMQPRFSEGKYLIWIAQSEELCDQAASCIKELWGQREFTDDLNLIRYYKGSIINFEKIESLNGGVVVASITQLYKRLNHDKTLDYILEQTGAMIIDEAHRAVTKMYDALFDRAKQLCSDDLFPVCGLTATPGRSNISTVGTEKLVNRFDATLFKPNLEGDPDYDPNNPLKYFKKRGYLAKARFHIINNNVHWKCDEAQLAELKKVKEEHCAGNDDSEFDEGSKLLKQLAKDEERNFRIIQELMKLPPDRRVLVYTCTVEHAIYLSSMLNFLGKTACAVSSETPTLERRALINDFKSGKIHFVFNYGVLTTGFDAPKTDTIVLCRPILSDILYEQIVGRGMRGPEFNGTEYCDIYDFNDTIENMGLPLAYKRFENDWAYSQD